MDGVDHHHGSRDLTMKDDWREILEIGSGAVETVDQEVDTREDVVMGI